MSRSIISVEHLTALFTKGDGTDNYELTKIIAPIFQNTIQGLLCKKFANQYGSQRSGGSIDYPRVVKNEEMIEMDSNMIVLESQFEAVQLNKTTIKTDIELETAKIKKFNKEDFEDADLGPLSLEIGIALENKMEEFNIDMQNRTDDMFLTAALDANQVVDLDWKDKFDASTSDMDLRVALGQEIYMHFQDMIREIVLIGSNKSTYLSPYWRTIDKNRIKIIVPYFIGQALRSFNLFAITRAQPNQLVHKGKFEDGAPTALNHNETFIGTIDNVEVHENKLMRNDGVSSAVLYNIILNQNYGLPFRFSESLLEKLPMKRFYGLQFYARYGLGVIWPETFWAGIESSVPFNKLSSKDLNKFLIKRDRTTLKVAKNIRVEADKHEVLLRLMKASQPKEEDAMDIFGKVGNTSSKQEEQTSTPKEVIATSTNAINDLVDKYV